MLAKSNAASGWFTEDFFHLAAEEMKSGKFPAKRMQHADKVVTGLRAQIFPTGLISYHCQFYVGEERPFMLIGYGHDKKDPLYLTVEEARNVARTIIALGNKGINPQLGLLPRLIKELKRDGERWRPK
jgi:hypothetical protein